jgi:hypothetical protein
MLAEVWEARSARANFKNPAFILVRKRLQNLLQDEFPTIPMVARGGERHVLAGIRIECVQCGPELAHCGIGLVGD